MCNPQTSRGGDYVLQIPSLPTPVTTAVINLLAWHSMPIPLCLDVTSAPSQPKILEQTSEKKLIVISAFVNLFKTFEFKL